MTAPYVVRNEQGEYKTFDLPTEGPGPYGASILLFLGQHEFLNVNLLASALQQAIVGEPPGGTWYKTAYVRAIRTAPIDSAPRAGTLPVAYEVEIMEIRIVINQEWGMIGQIRHGKQTDNQYAGNWVKLLGMTKIPPIC
jgi:hypothetical protein